MRKSKIDAMHELYGVSSGICGNCPHFVERLFDRKYFKCAVYGLSYSESTDWRKNWTACGLIEKEAPKQRPIVECLKKVKDLPEVLEGQVRME